MEMIPVFPVLLIAVIFFLVTMSLAIGPLLVCRLFLGAPKESGQRAGATASLATALAIAGAVIASVVVVYRSHESQESATVATEAASVPDAERSLFASESVATVPVGVPDGPAFGLSWAAILLPLLIVCSLLGLAGNWAHGGLSRLVPVAVVLAAALGLLVVWDVRDQNHRAHVAHQRELKQQETAMLAAHREAVAGADRLLSESRPDNEVIIEPDAETETPEESPLFIEYVSTSEAGVPRDTPPAWMNAPDGNGPIRVIESGLHATVELAEENALAQLKSMMLADFHNQHPDARGWSPSDAVVIKSDSILKRAIERSQIKVGEFTSPMYEAYWQVDTSKDASLYQAWRPTAVKSRLAWLGGGIGLLTLLFGSAAAVLRVDEQTGGRRRKALTFGTVALWAAVGGALLMLA